MKKLIQKLAHVTRSNDWRLSFVPFVMGCVYMWLWWFKIPFEAQTVWLTFLSLITTVGFASFGYFINEFFDKESDAKAGKINKLAYLPGSYQLGILLSSLALTFLPWLWLPKTILSISLIAVQIGLFLIYSMPFPRLKEHTYLSLIIDSSYAYVVPLLLSFYTFSLIAGQPGFPLWLYLFLCAVFFIGLRNIIIHQIKDVMKDYQSGIQTIPLVAGINTTKLILKTSLLYEVCFFILCMMVLQTERRWILVVMAAYLPMAIHSIAALRKNETVNYNQLLINYAYQYLTPLVMILLLGMQAPVWFVVLPLHIALLVPLHLLQKLFNIIKAIFSLLHRFIYNDVRNWLSAAVNFPIYYCFRACGVDLKKEKTSAWQFIQSRFTK